MATAKGVDWVRVILSRFSRDSSSIMDNDPALSDESLPHRDPFGLRKLIVVLTSSNTVCCSAIHVYTSTVLYVYTVSTTSS